MCVEDLLKDTFDKAELRYERKVRISVYLDIMKKSSCPLKIRFSLHYLYISFFFNICNLYLFNKTSPLMVHPLVLNFFKFAMQGFTFIILSAEDLIRDFIISYIVSSKFT